MSDERAVVLANGDCTAVEIELASISDADYIVCVDGGYRHSVTHKLKPNLLIGDFDSLNLGDANAVQEAGIECLRHPAEKDASDLELALDTLASKNFREVVMLGIAGGRTDHQLFNWLLCGRRSWPFHLRIIDSSVDGHVVNNERPFNEATSAGRLFSVLPIAESACVVTIVGAQYPLHDVVVEPGSTIGLSNVVTEPNLQVSVKQGTVLVMLVHSNS